MSHNPPPPSFICAECHSSYVTEVDESTGQPNFHTSILGPDKVICDNCAVENIKQSMIKNGRGLLYLQEIRVPEDYSLKFIDWRPNQVVDFTGKLKFNVLSYRTHRIKSRIDRGRDRMTFVWFYFDGSIWVGRNAHQHTQVCSVRRTKTPLWTFGIYKGD